MFEICFSVSLEISKLWAPYDRLPFPTTLRDVFSNFLDITSPPNNQILSMFAEYSESTVDQNNLLNLKDVRDESSRPEVFNQSSCSKKIYKIHSKTLFGKKRLRHKCFANFAQFSRTATNGCFYIFVCYYLINSTRLLALLVIMEPLCSKHPFDIPKDCVKVPMSAHQSFTFNGIHF